MIKLSSVPERKPGTDRHMQCGTSGASDVLLCRSFSLNFAGPGSILSLIFIRRSILKGIWNMFKFNLAENGTTVRTEIIAGITTFLSMVYILAVYPSVMSEIGIPRGEP